MSEFDGFEPQDPKRAPQHGGPEHLNTRKPHMRTTASLVLRLDVRLGGSFDRLRLGLGVSS